MNVRRAPQQGRQVDVQASNILARLVKQTELAKLLCEGSLPLIQVIDKPILPLPKEALAKTKRL
jgi:hypothetical protein